MTLPLVVFSGGIKRLARRFDGDSGGANVQIVTLHAADLTGTARCSVVCRAPRDAVLPVPGSQLEITTGPPAIYGPAVIAFDGIRRHDWIVEDVTVDHSFDATNVLSLPEVPTHLRAEAEDAADEMGVSLTFKPGHLLIHTNRGTLRKDLDIPGMIEPSLGWKKMLMELGLVT